MNNETLTVDQVLEITINLLGNIAVPRNLNDQVGIPIDRAISNLRICLEARMREQDKEYEEQEKQNEPDETNNEKEESDGNVSAE